MNCGEYTSPEFFATQPPSLHQTQTDRSRTGDIFLLGYKVQMKEKAVKLPALARVRCQTVRRVRWYQRCFPED